MHSLKIKLSLALLATSLTAVALFGGLSQWVVRRGFDQLAIERAFENFQADVGAYFETYGSWERGQKIQRFDHFVRSQRTFSGERPPPGFPPPPRHPPPGHPPPGPGGSGTPPFRFTLLDPQGKVLLGNEQLRSGQQAPADMLAEAKPISIGERVVALALPIGNAGPTGVDLRYLAAIREALLYALVAAGVLALVLGVFFSGRLSRSLHELTEAIRAMNQGDLRQRVKVHSKDEIGVLAETFNRMSADLAAAYEKLEHSNRTITQQAKLLKELSIRDELTQLYNRRHFNEQAAKLLAQAQRYGQVLSFMIGDIDFFKQINDNFSHAIGDEVLRKVSQILRSSIREADVAARYGGEEFVIAFPKTTLDEAARLCERLRRNIESHPWSTIHPGLKVTMSMGLNADTGLGGYEQMVAAADAKLYQAKENGRNRICY